VASKELVKFNSDQEGKFKGLQRLVAEFVVEKNEEMEALKRAVAELQVRLCWLCVCEREIVVCVS